MEKFGFIFADDEEEAKGEVEKPEVKFTEVLGEEHNYIVLYFDNSVDWLQAESLFDLKMVKALSTRADGKVTKMMETKGLGRVIRGRDALERLRKHYENLD